MKVIEIIGCMVIMSIIILSLDFLRDDMENSINEFCSKQNGSYYNHGNVNACFGNITCIKETLKEEGWKNCDYSNLTNVI